LIRSITYAAERPGPRFLILGAIHGNEKCGTGATPRGIDDIHSGRLFISSGQVTFVPVANPRAYELDRRFTERNLNRYLVPMEKPDSYEAQLGNILCPMLAACDILLDIHSYTVGGPAFASVDKKRDNEKAFAAILGAHALIGGWEEAYATTGRFPGTGSKESIGTTEYARRFGAMATLIECGQHNDPQAPEIAYHAIRNALRYLEMTPEPKPELPSIPQLINVTHVYYRDSEGTFPKAWKNLEHVKKGETLAVDGNGLPILAPEDGFIVMPKADCPIGEEWFYFGV
jgi:predicted deacylase